MSGPTAPVPAATAPTSDVPVAVRTVQLRKVFGELVAVEGLDLTINKGEVFGVLGPDGSGKTTTIRMLCGLIAPTSGTATVVGFDIVTQAEQLRRRIGYMSQRFGLYDDLTVRENLRFYSAVYGMRGAELDARMTELMDNLDLAPLASQLVSELSGGWKQRLALACAIAHRPDMLFLDEPTAGVDPAARRHFWEIVHQLASSGTTILVTTHYMDEAGRCDRVAFLSRGRLIALGTPAAVSEQFGLSSIEDVFIELQKRDEGVTV